MPVVPSSGILCIALDRAMYRRCRHCMPSSRLRVFSKCTQRIIMHSTEGHFTYMIICVLYWNVPCWGHQLWDINCRMCVCVCVCLSVCPPTYRYIAPRMIQRIILKLCGYVGCDDATNVSNFGYEPIKPKVVNGFS